MWWRKITKCCAAAAILAVSNTAVLSDELKVAVFDNWPPDQWAENGELKGFSVELVQLVAEELDLKIVLEPTTFDSIIPGLASGRYQIGVGSFAPTGKRLTQVDFATVNSNGSGVGLRASDSRELKVGKDLCGLEIGVITGATDASKLEVVSNESCTGADAVPIKVAAFPTPAAALLALQSNRIDGISRGFNQLRYLESQQAEVRGADYAYSVVYQSWALPKGSDFNPRIVEALNRIIADGRYAEIMKKWNVSEATIPQSVLLTSSSDEKELVFPAGN